MVRRGSTVRVRQRALQKARKTDLCCSDPTCNPFSVRWVWSLYGASRSKARRQSPDTCPISAGVAPTGSPAPGSHTWCLVLYAQRRASHDGARDGEELAPILELDQFVRRGGTTGGCI